MYQYIYDSFLNDSKFSVVLAAVESRVTDLGISGKIDRLSIFKNIREIISDGIKRGTKTLVIVGNDLTLNRVINAVPNFNDITLGFIPIGPKNKIAKILGIPEGVAAVDVLSFRRIEKLDLGQINDSFFLSEIEVLSPRVTLKCNKSFNVLPKEGSRVAIYNLPAKFSLCEQGFLNPQDGLLEVFIESKNKFKKFPFQIKKNSGDSIFLFKNLLVNGDLKSAVLVDESKIMNMPVEIKVLSRKLKMIIGKERFF